MTKLRDTLDAVVEDGRGRLSPSSADALRRYAAQMERTAELIGADEPCQELYDAYMADDRGSRERRLKHLWVARMVDARAGTLSVGPDGLLYNEPRPSAGEAEAAFAAHGLPADGLDVWLVAARARSALEGVGLSASTVGQYDLAWRQLAGHVRRTTGSTAYSEASASAFAALGADGWRGGMRRKAMSVIEEVARTGTYEWRVDDPRSPRAPTEELESLRGMYAADLRARNLSEPTVAQRDRLMRVVLEGSGARSVADLSGIGPDDVAGMVSRISRTCCARSLSTLLPQLRGALDFLAGAGICAAGLSGLVMSPVARRVGTASFLAPGDEGALVRSLGDAPLRDRAIMLLALRLGLRASDIRLLRFDEVDWLGDRIRLTQSKTGRMMTLPLLPEVGNAIMDYVERERPAGARGCPYVFVRSRAPYVPLRDLYDVSRRSLERAGVGATGGSDMGTHLMRRTLARRLLEARVPQRLISDSLGHAGPESDKAYLPLDEEGLRACALDLSLVGVPAWCGEVG